VLEECPAVQKRIFETLAICFVTFLPPSNKVYGVFTTLSYIFLSD
jgi:hypothetical protein